LKEHHPFGGFTFKTLGVALFHGHLKKLAIMQRVNRVTESVRIERRIDLLEGDV
jgi:hypothetical protein